MKKENLEFIFELARRIAETHGQYRNDDCKIELEHHESKDYYTIDFVLKSGNSIYEDCIVFYLSEDNFNPTEIIDDFDNIIEKSKILLK